MATEAIVPDAIAASTNLTGAVTDIDETPVSSDDGNWLTASSVADTEVRVTFGTPTGPPNTGSGLQSFEIRLRKDATGGGTPTFDVELWEGGALVSVLSSGNSLTATGTGTVHTETWDATLLGTADGSAVECRVVGERSGGVPGQSPNG